MLKILPEHISNLIAAGEVIQRPASVVKELLENSVDAGSTVISLIVTDFGKTLIQVIDNGVGMNREEAQLCFASHATSKIEKVEDLEKITTFGFRGEALASIAACADVLLKCRKKGEDTGTQVHIENAKIESVTEISASQGCNISVRNLFYNIPARRKFLKSDSSEYRQILNEFVRVALTRLDIEFRFISNTKEVMRFVANESLKQRIATITNSSSMKVSKELIPIEIETSVVGISGYIGTPQSAKKSQQNTYLFVNDRYFRSPLLHKAIIKGYSQLIPQELIPQYFIFLRVPSEEIDVNISPSKTEVKFENESSIFQIIEATVKEAVGKNAFAPSIMFGDKDTPQEIVSADGFTLTPEERLEYKRRGISKPKIDYDPLFNPFETTSENRTKGESLLNNFDGESLSDSSAQYQPADSQVEGYLTEKLLQLEDIVIIPKYDHSELMVLNIVRAKQKIFYEGYLKHLKSADVAVEENLFPVSITLDHASYTAITENVEYMLSIGFDIKPFGKDTILVAGTPTNFKSEKYSIEDCVEEIAHLLGEESRAKSEAKSENLLPENIARKVTSYTNFAHQRALTQQFIEELLKQLLSLPNPSLAPLGGYCFATISYKQLKQILL